MGDLTAGKQRSFLFEREITKVARLPYLLFLPKGYEDNPQQQWPLILFLHGRGERGDNPEVLKRHGIPKIIDQRPDFPFIAVSPQCPVGSWWINELPALHALLEDILSSYRVDRDRVYLTGMSMGGYGAWALATEHPELFAALTPICGGGDPERACVLKSIPTWVFHGSADDVVPVLESQVMVDALKACGGNVLFTLYTGVGHDSWTQTYENPELYQWFLKQRRQAGEKESRAAGE